MKYGDVENFCKEICLRDSNREQFLNFKKDYSYFSPYFDFVMVNKGYLFFNPLYNEKMFMLFDNGAYYLNDLISIDYAQNVKFYEERKSRSSFSSDFTIVSDSELGIAVQDVDSVDECMIDPNMMGMMSKTGVTNSDGSHVVTGATILNQLLIKSSKIADFYYSYLDNYGYADVSDAVNFLVRSMGFLRVGGKSDYRIVIGNKEASTGKVKTYLDMCDKLGFKVIEAGKRADSIIEEYQEQVGTKAK